MSTYEYLLCQCTSCSCGNVYSQCSASPHIRVYRYWSFTLAASFPDDSSSIMKFHTNNNNSFGSLFLNKDILNLCMPNVSDLVFINNLTFTSYLSVFKSLLLLIMGICGVYIWIFTVPVQQLFLWELFFTVSFLFYI